MQTFLPYINFTQSARALDYRRLGKQRVEAHMILKLLWAHSTVGWAHHPAVKMWRGYDQALILYYNACVQEWTARNYRNSMPLYVPNATIQYPPWLNERLCSNHRTALLYKAERRVIHEEKYDEADWYKQFG